MRRLNWRDPADYAYIANLWRDHRAWEFLRRNPDYHADWLWFSTTWQALETDYGRPPARDFQLWQQDLRAYRAECTALLPNVRPVADQEGERLLIECRMGVPMALRQSTAP